MSRDDEKKTFKHPSYGMVQFNRVHNGTGRCRLFGSSIQDHHGTVRLCIRGGKLEHDLHHDRYYADGRAFIEVELSSAQFVELITTPNQGFGVPCTIRYLNGQIIEDPPEIETEVERIKNNFNETLTHRVATMRERRKAIEELTKSLSAKAKARLKIELDVMIGQLSEHVPFVLRMFNEASDRVVTAAKQEIEAFTAHALRTAGLEALANKLLPPPDIAPPALPAPPATPEGDGG